MPRNSRVLSFISQWGIPGGPKSPTRHDAPSPLSKSTVVATSSPVAPPAQSRQQDSPMQSSPVNPNMYQEDSRPSSRPISMVQTAQPKVMEVTQDTLPELQRIFTYLNSHSNKLYQEGYFLKLHDLDSRGRPSTDRTWNECFAQLVGTVLSLWDAAQLDTAGEDGTVVPSFINLADASIKMIPSLPMNGPDGQSLQNVLSISTAANNRYLLHFNSLNSLTQWTAGIRLAMYEHATLQEAYTGSLIAGKGKSLNSIREIMDHKRLRHEDWARVRFGAGTPWKRCWCVVVPPDEKEYAKIEKTHKKKTIYDRSVPLLRGDVKFYETKKITKKTKPIATITDAFSAYAIYPQSKPLIDQSTLVKVEGKITIHSKPESTTEGFVFIMPEVHPAVTGFEIMLRFIFPLWDTFGLYGRPNRLVADPIDSRGLMFAIPNARHYGYLEILDVAGLIHTEGSQNWTERQWRKQMKDLTAQRMSATPTREHGSRSNSRRNTSRISLPATRSAVRFDDNSQPASRRGTPPPSEFDGPRRTDSAPLGGGFRHRRSVSEANGYNKHYSETSSPLSYAQNMGGRDETPPPAPPHRIPFAQSDSNLMARHDAYDSTSEDERQNSGYRREGTPGYDGPGPFNRPPLEPVAAPPAFAHAPSQKPPSQPYQSTEMRNATAQMDQATLSQLADASKAPLPGGVAAAGAAAAWKSRQESPARENRRSFEGGRRSGEYERRGDDRGQRAGYGEGNYRGTQSDQSAYNTGASNQWPIHGGQRLPTIPASPYIEQTEPSSATQGSFQPVTPSVPEQVEPPHYFDQHTQGQYPMAAGYSPSSPPKLGSQNSVSRKPIPGRSLSPRAETAASSSSSPPSSNLNSLRSHVVDPEMLDRVLNNPQVSRVASISSSNYDNESLASTDYASTISAEADSKRTTDKPRAGVLKTVGTVQPDPKPDVVVGDVLYKEQQKQEEKDGIPNIDFGPTYLYTPDIKKRPGTSGTLTQAGHDANSKSQERLAEPDHDPNLIGTAVSTHTRMSSNSSPANGSGSGSPAQGGTPPGTSSKENRRSVAWQPGIAQQPHHQPSRQSMSAEEWVQQRASMASLPYAPPRHSPSQNLGHKSSVSTPSITRNPSGDWTSRRASQGVRNSSPGTPGTPGSGSGSGSRPHTREGVPSRPHSRGASVMLGQQQGMTLDTNPTSLTAREQEYVARVTGTPLVNLASNSTRRPRPPSTGLVGAIEKREEEKKTLKKKGMGGASVQNAIFARQQQQAQAAAQAAQAQARFQAQQGLMGYGNNSPVNNVPSPSPSVGQPLTPQGFGGGSPYMQQQQQQQMGGYFPQQQQQQRMSMGNLSMSGMSGMGMNMGTSGGYNMQAQSPQQMMMQQQHQHQQQQYYQQQQGGWDQMPQQGYRPGPRFDAPGGQYRG